MEYYEEGLFDIIYNTVWVCFIVAILWKAWKSCNFNN